MGYTSDVFIAVYGEPLSLAAHVARWKGSIPDQGTLLWVTRGEVPIETHTVLGDSAMYRLEFSAVKWFDSYEDVKHVMRLLSELDAEESSDLVGEIVRIGEDATDIERDTFGNADLCEYRYQLHREVNFE